MGFELESDLGFDRSEVADCRVHTFGIVKVFDVVAKREGECLVRLKGGQALSSNLLFAHAFFPVLRSVRSTLRAPPEQAVRSQPAIPRAGVQVTR